VGVEGRVIDPARVDVEQRGVDARPISPDDSAARLFASTGDDFPHRGCQFLFVSGGRLKGRKINSSQSCFIAIPHASRSPFGVTPNTVSSPHFTPGSLQDSVKVTRDNQCIDSIEFNSDTTRAPRILLVR
jgi:hypothetical protein